MRFLVVAPLHAVAPNEKQHLKPAKQTLHHIKIPKIDYIKFGLILKKRCLNEKASNYKNYGGRGISICNDWLEYESFKLWSLSNGYTDELTIDRIDVNGDYEPNNCRWVTHTVQANNRRNNTFYEIDGIKHTLAEWAKLYYLKYKSLYKQIKYNNRNLSEFIQL